MEQLVLIVEHAGYVGRSNIRWIINKQRFQIRLGSFNLRRNLWEKYFYWYFYFCTEFLAISENKVAIIYSAGGLGDEGYNDLAHKALNKAKFDLGIDFDYYEPIDPVKETERQLMAYSDSKSYWSITVGFLSKSSLEKAAKEYPNQKYAIVDEIVFDSKNITSITFNVEEESFLAGAVAALMTKTDKVAFIGGTEPH